jgi:hypothetical protein
MRGVFWAGDFRDGYDHVPDMVEIRFDYGDGIVALGELIVEEDHEAFNCGEEGGCAFIWRVGIDFGIEVDGALGEKGDVLVGL